MDFGGYDADNFISTDTAWIFSASLEDVISGN